MPYQDPPALQESIVREEPHTGERMEHEMLKGAYAELETDLADAKRNLEELQAAHDRLKDEHAAAIKKSETTPPEMKAVTEDGDPDAE